MNTIHPHRPLSFFKSPFWGFSGVLLVFLFFAACSVEDDPIQGSISFTSNADCHIRLFDSRGNQIERGQYEVEKEPFVVPLKRTGIYVVHAESDGNPTKRDPITFVGSMEYYIEF